MASIEMMNRIVALEVQVAELQRLVDGLMSVSPSETLLDRVRAMQPQPTAEQVEGALTRKTLSLKSKN